VLPDPPEGLRHWRLADAPALEAAWADATVRLWNPPPADADATSWIMRCDERWTLRLSIDFVIDVDGDVGGEVGLRNFTTGPDRAELGVWVAPAHRRRGVALSSVRTVTRWARHELGLAQVWCRTAPGNDGAVALFAAAGWDRLGLIGDRVVWSSTHC
jgi:ribosomal-protein-alanine N-acetyltransferase